MKTIKECHTFGNKGRDDKPAVAAEKKDMPASALLFSIAKDNSGNFLQQEVVSRITHMATVLEDDESHKAHQENLTSHAWNRR